jgi:hypothetical protein
MGRLTLILSVLFIAILVSFFISHSEKAPALGEITANQQAAAKAKYTSNFALQYGIQQLLSGNVTFTDSTFGSINDFSAFQTLEGQVDSIHFYNNTSQGNIRVTAYSHYGASSHESSAEIEIVLGTDALSNITAAITTGGNITLKAKSVIEGEVYADTTFSFDDIFGMPEQTIIDHAVDNNAYYVNPPNSQAMPDSIMWVEGNFKVTSHWQGSGVLVVKGDLDVTAQMDFDGILVVFGTLSMSAFSSLTGAVFIISDGESSIGAHSEIVFNAEVVASSFSSLPSNATYKILSWRE